VPNDLKSKEDKKNHTLNIYQARDNDHLYTWSCLTDHSNSLQLLMVAYHTERETELRMASKLREAICLLALSCNLSKIVKPEP
jgi:hypothetical protein